MNLHAFAKPTCRRGFSIPELLVVLVIITILTTTAVLAYGNFRKATFTKAGAEKVKAAITQARTRAIASNIPCSVVFDLNNHVIWSDDMDMLGNVRKPKIIPVEDLGDDVIISQVQIGANTYTTGTRRATFLPDGTNPLVTVHLRRSMDDSTVDQSYYSVQIYPTSGEARVWAHVRR
ncbi:prepilin-type N-terminal cleavage/methylation domain-containing protein [Candidatus Sumerlaeota bacterium]|nr:prepilin-type N-terminal cleavage/methylation domain-containing protein [Candidatus Sumerlaeota bacterium]